MAVKDGLTQKYVWKTAYSLAVVKGLITGVLLGLGFFWTLDLLQPGLEKAAGAAVMVGLVGGAVGMIWGLPATEPKKPDSE